MMTLMMTITNFSEKKKTKQKNKKQGRDKDSRI